MGDPRARKRLSGTLRPVEDQIIDSFLSDGGKKIDLFGTSSWYSDTTHVKDRYVSMGEFDQWRDIDQWDKEYQQGGEMDMMNQEDVIMPVFSREYNEEAETHAKIGDVSVNPKNRVMRQYDSRDDTYEDISHTDRDTHIWGDILDEGGDKTGTQVLLKPKFNARRVEEGNLSKLFDPTPPVPLEDLQRDKSGRYIIPKPPPGYGLDVPQNKSLYLTAFGHIQELSNKVLDMKGAEIGWELKKGGVKQADRDKYIYRDADGTQYYSPQAPF